MPPMAPGSCWKRWRAAPSRISKRLLAAERERQKNPARKQKYRAIRPKVERKLGHLMRRRHGGRRARVRGRIRVAQDFALLAAATNFARLAVLRALG